MGGERFNRQIRCASFGADGRVRGVTLVIELELALGPRRLVPGYLMGQPLRPVALKASLYVHGAKVPPSFARAEPFGGGTWPLTLPTSDGGPFFVGEEVNVADVAPKVTGRAGKPEAWLSDCVHVMRMTWRNKDLCMLLPGRREGVGNTGFVPNLVTPSRNAFKGKGSMANEKSSMIDHPRGGSSNTHAQGQQVAHNAEGYDTLPAREHAYCGGEFGKP